MASSKLLVAVVVLYLAVAAGFVGTIWYLNHKVEHLVSAQSAAESVVPPPPIIAAPNIDAHWNRLWNGFDPMLGDFSLLNREFDQLFNRLSMPSGDLDQFSTTSPRISLEEDAKEYRVTVEAPEGMDVEIETELKESHLTVSGSVAGTTQDDQSQAKFSSAFSRSVLLDEPVEQAEMEVINEEGRITVRVPKRLS